MSFEGCIRFRNGTSMFSGLFTKSVPDGLWRVGRATVRNWCPAGEGDIKGLTTVP